MIDVLQPDYLNNLDAEHLMLYAIEKMKIDHEEKIIELKDELLSRPPLPLEGEARSRILQELGATGIDEAIHKFRQQAEQIRIYESAMGSDPLAQISAESHNVIVGKLKQKLEEQDAKIERLEELIDYIESEIDENPNDCRLALNHYYGISRTQMKGQDNGKI